MRKATVLLAVVFLAVSGAALGRSDFIILASTTSTENSGLLGYLTPRFEADSGIEVRVIAVGTGQALELARRGDAHALLVHAPAAEKAFVEAGHGLDRREVMYNDYVVVGPVDDPADVAEVESAAGAFARIAETQAPFASRADDSGTHKKEMEIWEAAGIEPKGEWYRELGSGMGATLNTAAAMNAYALADRGTWISFENRQDLEILNKGGEILYNQYGSILVDPERISADKAEAARAWHEWLVSEEGQALIAGYRMRDRQLFFPNAR